MRFEVAINTPPRWKKEVIRFVIILLAARSGSWNSSKKMIGDVWIKSLASQSME
jgi:hypothetical protein